MFMLFIYGSVKYPASRTCRGCLAYRAATHVAKSIGSGLLIYFEFKSEMMATELQAFVKIQTVRSVPRVARI